METNQHGGIPHNSLLANEQLAAVGTPTHSSGAAAAVVGCSGDTPNSLHDDQNRQTSQPNEVPQELLDAARDLGLEGLAFNGDQNLPTSIQQIVVPDDESGNGSSETIVQLTERQQLTMQNKLNTLRKLKNSSRMGPMSEIFQNNTNQNVEINSRIGENFCGVVDSPDGNFNNKPEYPLNPKLQMETNLLRYQSTPDLQQSFKKNSSLVGNFKSRNIKRFQKFKSFFTTKVKQKGFSVTTNQDTNPSNRSPKVRRSSISNTDRANPPSIQYQETNRVQIRYFKYNASYRKRDRTKADFQSHKLLEQIKLQPNNSLLPQNPPNSIMLNFGVNFKIDAKSRLTEISLQPNVTVYEDFTKNLAIAASKVAYCELEADLIESLPHSKTSTLIQMPIFSGTRKKTHPNFLFGGHLTQLHEWDNQRGEYNEYPSVLKHMIEYISERALQEEGIFRIAGTRNRLLKLKEEITDLYLRYYKQNIRDDKSEIFGIFDKYTPYDVASLLKMFIRQLAQPLLTKQLMEIFLLVPLIPNFCMQLKILNLLMLILNDTHRNSLSALLGLLNSIARNENDNKMSLEGISIMLAPNLFIAQQLTPITNRGDSPKNPLVNNLAQSKRISISSQSVDEMSPEMLSYLQRTTNSLTVLKLLINLYPILFHIPPYLYGQLKKKDDSM